MKVKLLSRKEIMDTVGRHGTAGGQPSAPPSDATRNPRNSVSHGDFFRSYERAVAWRRQGSVDRGMRETLCLRIWQDASERLCRSSGAAGLNELACV